MSGDSYLIDTNIILYLLNGDEKVAEILNGQNLIVSFITELELLGFKGLSGESKRIIKEFISECTVFDINQEIKNNAIAMRRKYGLKLPDAIIAGTSQYLNCPLLTADTDFSKIEEISVILYSVS